MSLDVVLAQQGQIIKAGLDQLQLMVSAIDAILSLRPAEADTEGPPYVIVNNAQIHQALINLCTAQATAYACLFDDGTRKTESPRHNKMRLARVSEIKNICSAVSVDQLRRRGVRNALAHFDERLLKQLDRKTNAPWFQDLGLSHKDIFSPIDEGKMIRVYLFREDKLIMLGEELSLIPLREEALGIISIISQLAL